MTEAFETINDLPCNEGNWDWASLADNSVFSSWPEIKYEGNTILKLFLKAVSSYSLHQEMSVEIDHVWNYSKLYAFQLSITKPTENYITT